MHLCKIEIENILCFVSLKKMCTFVHLSRKTQIIDTQINNF